MTTDRENSAHLPPLFTSYLRDYFGRRSPDLLYGEGPHPLGCSGLRAARGEHLWSDILVPYCTKYWEVVVAYTQFTDMAGGWTHVM